MKNITLILILTLLTGCFLYRVDPNNQHITEKEYLSSFSYSDVTKGDLLNLIKEIFWEGHVPNPVIESYRDALHITSIELVNYTIISTGIVQHKTWKIELKQTQPNLVDVKVKIGIEYGVDQPKHQFLTTLHHTTFWEKLNKKIQVFHQNSPIEPIDSVLTVEDKNSIKKEKDFTSFADFSLETHINTILNTPHLPFEPLLNHQQYPAFKLFNIDDINPSIKESEATFTDPLQ